MIFPTLDRVSLVCSSVSKRISAGSDGDVSARSSTMTARIMDSGVPMSLVKIHGSAGQTINDMSTRIPLR